MTRAFECKACNERAVYECVSFDKENNFGDFRRCNLCGDVRPMPRRRAAKTAEREALIARLAIECEGC